MRGSRSPSVSFLVVCLSFCFLFWLFVWFHNSLSLSLFWPPRTFPPSFLSLPSERLSMLLDRAALLDAHAALSGGSLQGRPHVVLLGDGVGCRWIQPCTAPRSQAAICWLFIRQPVSSLSGNLLIKGTWVDWWLQASNRKYWWFCWLCRLSCVTCIHVHFLFVLLLS